MEGFFVVGVLLLIVIHRRPGTELRLSDSKLLGHSCGEHGLKFLVKKNKQNRQESRGKEVSWSHDEDVTLKPPPLRPPLLFPLDPWRQTG